MGDAGRRRGKGREALAFWGSDGLPFPGGLYPETSLSWLRGRSAALITAGGGETSGNGSGGTGPSAGTAGGSSPLDPQRGVGVLRGSPTAAETVPKGPSASWQRRGNGRGFKIKSDELHMNNCMAVPLGERGQGKGYFSVLLFRAGPQLCANLQNQHEK